MSVVGCMQHICNQQHTRGYRVNESLEHTYNVNVGYFRHCEIQFSLCQIKAISTGINILKRGLRESIQYCSKTSNDVQGQDMSTEESGKEELNKLLKIQMFSNHLPLLLLDGIHSNT